MNIMNNKNILVLTMSQSQSKYEVTRLKEEAEKMGVRVKKALYREVTFDLNGKGKVFVQGEEINASNTAAVWFRVAGTKTGKYTEGRNVLIRILQAEGIFCCNHEGYTKWARMGKIAQHGLFITSGVAVVPTKIYYMKSQIQNRNPNPTLFPFGDLSTLEEGKGKIIKEEFFDWEFPIISKHDRGFQGKSVRKFNNWEEVNKWLNRMDETHLGMFLWQKCLPTKWDLRVIVLGGKAIGAMKRSAVGEEFRSNFSLGGAVEKWELSDEDKIMAEKVAAVCGLDYAGVDIMKDADGTSYVLEVNRQCQYQGFEKATGINVARLVVEMLLDG